MATIILPEEPDASKGKYYRLDRVEEGKIIFEQELQPRARVPYIIVPNEDFSIDLSTLDLAGCYQDTVSIEGISFIGSFVNMELPALTGGEGGGSFHIEIIDTTPDCGFTEETKAFIGALRAYLTWNDPIDHGGARGLDDKMEIVLRDYGTKLASPLGETEEGGVIYNLFGQRLNEKQKGINIVGGKKVLVK
ncbi:MAG: hypothetical protein J5733_05055 [Bacteroidaceae bacterium]|nr:hypothetical protein [Bacteroidaceae bacterium]